MDIDTLFKGMKEAPVFGRGNYMGEGLFDVAMKKIFVKHTFKGADLFIAEFEILTSTHEKHPVGSSGSWAPKLALPNTFGDIKCLFFAIMGTDPKDVQAGDVEAHNLASVLARAACGSDAAKVELKALGIDNVEAVTIGKRARLETKQITTKENKPFTRYTWAPYGVTAQAQGGAQ